MYYTNKSNLFFLVLLATLMHLGLLSQSGKEKVAEKLDNEVLELMSDGDIPGLTLVIVTEDSTTINTYGYADLETFEKVTSKTLFEIGSCSKAFTALAIQDLVEKGKIDLDSFVSDYLPEFKVKHNEDLVKITVGQLLHHTSGIPWKTIASIPESEAKDALEKTVGILRNAELDNLPGERYQYATINYDVLALILQKVTKLSFEDYMQKNVFEELELANTTIGKPKADVFKATGYKIGFFNPRPYKAPRYKGNNAAGYVISNGTDIAQWLKLQLDLQPSEWRERIRATHDRDKTVPPHGVQSYAKGWEVSLNGTNEISHAGINPNFTSHIILRPDEKMGIAVLSNSNSAFTPIIAERAMGLSLGKELGEMVNPGDNNDGFFSMLTIALGIYILLVIAYLIWTATDFVRGKRSFSGLNTSKTVKLFLPLVLVLPFVYGLYLLPEATVGFNWKSILVWTPVSAEILLKFVLLTGVISYVAHVIGLFLPEKDYYRQRLPKILLFSILSGLSNVLVIIMITSALNSPMELRYILFYYVLVLSVYLLGRRFVQVKLTKIAVSLVYDMRMKVLSKVLQTSYQKLEKMENGRVFSVINDDSNTIGRSATLFVNLITSLITIIGTFVYLFSISLWATALVITMMISLVVLYNFVGRSAHKYFEAARDEQNTFMSLINGLVDGLKEISQHRKKKEEYKEDLSNSASRFKEKNTIADIKFINGFLVGESLLLILLGVVSMGLSRLFPEISFFTLMSFVIVLLYLIGPINSVLGAVPEIMRLKVSWNRIQKFLHEIPADMKSLESENQIETVSEIQELKVEGVCFDYDNKDADQNNFGIGPIDFEVRQGEVLFITGGNGSGKTTLAKILTGLYKPIAGSISIDGEEVSNIELSEYFSTVFNPPYLFKKLYGINSSEKKDEIAHFLEVLKLNEKVSLTNNEFSTLDLSSGQRKRLGLLKCYLEDSPIYLFDEWAADQDPEFRYFFYKTLIPRMKAEGKIVIAISHDDFYFDVADKVVNMREGKSSLTERRQVVEHF